jgi:hypothetical protein
MLRRGSHRNSVPVEYRVVAVERMLAGVKCPAMAITQTPLPIKCRIVAVKRL